MVDAGQPGCRDVGRLPGAPGSGERCALHPRTSCGRGYPPQERRFSEPRLRKAELHTWLAWQEEPGQPFGTSITARVLDGDRPQAREFIGWLRRLYEIGGGSSQ
ncbi:MAG: DUF3226 domain-containing protein [Armatimonadota bacterium]